MALSNWDILMLDEKGKSLPGVWQSSLGLKLEIYKNWLHLHDEKAWYENAGFYSKPIIAKIDSGSYDYKNLHILAIRGPQNGVFVIVWEDFYSKDYKKHWVRGAIGCGVYGYTQGISGRYIGVTKTSLRWFIKEMHKKDFYTIPDVFVNLDLLKGQRYNQGDAFFTCHIGTPLQNTKAGKAKETIFGKAIKQMEIKER
jgi:hypothetical protein